MKTRMISMFAVIAMVITMMSCVSTKVAERKPHWVPFTKSILNNPDYKLTQEILRDSTQFALGPIPAIFERKVVEKEIRFLNGKMISTYVDKFFRDTLRAFTPCVMLSIDTADGLMRQNFGDSLYLVFGPDEKDNYVLYGDEGLNQVTYRGSSWQISSGGNNTATLYIDLDTQKEVRKIGKTLSGVTIAGTSKKKK